MSFFFLAAIHSLRGSHRGIIPLHCRLLVQLYVTNQLELELNACAIRCVLYAVFHFEREKMVCTHNVWAYFISVILRLYLILSFLPISAERINVVDKCLSTEYILSMEAQLCSISYMIMVYIEFCMFSMCSMFILKNFA